MLEIGGDIIDGIIRGIQAAGARIGEVLNGIVQDAINNIKKNLGISSPSTVFAEMGMQMMNGLALGIRRSGALPQLALDTSIGALSANIAPAAMGQGGGSYTAEYHNNFYDALATKMYLEQQRLERQRSVKEMF